jgi:hypothetical protein
MVIQTSCCELREVFIKATQTIEKTSNCVDLSEIKQTEFNPKYLKEAEENIKKIWQKGAE